jgi:predicted transcriptional regulator
MQDIKNTVNVFKALAHETRLSIVLGLIKGNECNVSRIIESLNLPQSTISKHLNVLRTAGIIEGYRKSNMICYKVVNEAVVNLIKNIE